MIKRIINKLKRPNLTSKRFINSCLNLLSRSLKMPHVYGFPEMMAIEPANICNLKCPLCPCGSGKMKREKGMMSLDNFKKIIDETGDYLYDLALSNYGEPFLNPQIMEMAAYAKKKGITTRLQTNALLIDRSWAAAIVESGLDSIIVSLDGIDQESYGSYRLGGHISKVIEAVRYIVEEKNKRHRSAPQVIVQCLMMKQTEPRIEEFRQFAKSLKADQIVLKRIIDMNGFPSDLDHLEKYLPSDPAQRAYKIENGRIQWNSEKQDINFCPMAWNYPVVNWDGALFPCCFDYDFLDMGNVFHAGFKEVWNNKRLAGLRRDIIKRKASLPICGSCPVNVYSDIVKDID
jgi:radical SAM protein with 4Fe4S-binding SPASM domain